jgi:hypothetical protein
MSLIAGCSVSKRSIVDLFNISEYLIILIRNDSAFLKEISPLKSETTFDGAVITSEGMDGKPNEYVISRISPMLADLVQLFASGI